MAEDVDVILHATHANHRAIQAIARSAQILVSLFAKRLVLQKSLALLGGEHDVEVHLGARLRHAGLLDLTPSG